MEAWGQAARQQRCPGSCYGWYNNPSTEAGNMWSDVGRTSTVTVAAGKDMHATANTHTHAQWQLWYSGLITPALCLEWQGSNTVPLFTWHKWGKKTLFWQTEALLKLVFMWQELKLLNAPLTTKNTCVIHIRMRSIYTTAHVCIQIQCKSLRPSWKWCRPAQAHIHPTSTCVTKAR